MKASVNNSTGVVGVSYYPMHYGHSRDLGHLRLTNADRQKIATEIKMAVNPQKILCNLRSTSLPEGKSFARVNLATKKDLWNITKSYGLDPAIRHGDDGTSLAALLSELSRESYSPVLLQKFQNEVNAELPLLSEEDFILVLQTKMQLELMKSFSTDGVVCMDSTHGTNEYGFPLITLLVVDDFGQGCPVAWCVSNKEDRISLVYFLQAVKRNCDKAPEIRPSWFMSDDAPQYFSAWTEVFSSSSTNSPPPTKLLCSWHVERAWKGHLKAISDIDLQKAIYKQLKVMMQFKDKQSLHQLIAKSIIELKSRKATQAFGKYFEKEYASRAEQWAQAYRKGSKINTNMYLEAFHRTLKHGSSYMHGKVNRRMDQLVYVLLRFAEDQLYDRVVKLEKGKRNFRLEAIATNHTKSEKVDPKAAVAYNLEKKSWTVRQNDKSLVTVQKTDIDKPCCNLICRRCCTCVHQFLCSCSKGSINDTICEHVHIVQQFLQKEEGDSCISRTSLLL
ncbi:uncharacterized protein [Oscarella lobularis]|uniref:uncharacterized protein n=1 Tax=Oscarella lobularis TaxID=121494 RepID=UPI003313A002